MKGVGLSLAAENGTHVVVSGPRRLVRSLCRRLGKRGVRTEDLRTSHAFHSGLLDPVLDELEEAAGALGWVAPEVSLVGNLTGREVGPGEVWDGGYWRRQGRERVRYAAGVEALAELGVGLLIEVGPRAVLGPLAALGWPEGAPAPALVTSLGRETGFAEAVSGAYEAGLGVSFAGLFAGERRRRVSLPTYPFQRQRHWVRRRRGRRREPGHPLLGARRVSGSGEVTCETELFARDPSWLGDHRVFGRVVVPAAFYGAQAVAAARGAGTGAVRVADVRFDQPLFLPEDEDEGRLVQFVLGSGTDSGERGWQVFSRTAEEEAWVRYAAGRLATGPPEVREAPVDPERLAESLEPVEAAGVYRTLGSRGIAHGPAFRGLSRIWSGEDEAFAELAPPEPLPGSEYVLHPVLLDACFQVLAGIRGLAAEGESAPESPLLPAGWDLLWLDGPLPERVRCHARLLARGRGGERSAGETRRASLVLYGTDGNPVGGIEGLELLRATRAALGRAGDDVAGLLYEVAWREGPALPGAGFLSGPAAVAGRLGPVEGYLEAEGTDGASLASAIGELEGEALGWALGALEELGWKREAGDRFESEELRRRLKVTGDHRRLFERVLGWLEEAGVLSRDPAGGWRVERGTGAGPPAEARVAEDAHVLVERALLRRCGASLAEVLRGRRDPLELLFGAEPGAADLYANSTAGRAGNRLVADAFAAAVRGTPVGRRLRVVEVGAGTGATTAAVLPLLPPGRTDYAFTDISAGFFGAAEERFGAGGVTLRCRVLDIERAPEEQGFREHGYDVVIAANVLHATRDLGEALAHCRRLLAPSGLLVAAEGTVPRRWLDLTFGLLPGWWGFDDRYRSGYALVGPDVWRRALGDAGYGEVAFVGAELGSAVILARGPAEVTPERGLFVLAGGGAFAPAVAEELSRCGQEVLVGPEGGDREAWRSLFASLPDEVPLRGVAHLSGVRGDGAETAPEAFAAELEAVGGSALSLVQGLTDAGARPSSGLWFVTRGGQVLEGEDCGALPGALLWGFGSVVEREYGDLRPRLVDLDPLVPASASAVVEELLHPDGETRAARRAGRRRVARLVRAAAGAAPAEGGLARVRADRSYLVTGGLGGIGLEVAGWLADAGAGAVVLNGRREPDARAAAAVEALRGRGVDVRVEIADVTDGEALEAMLARMDTSGPALGGVIHSVGVLADAAITNQDWGRFEEVLLPKALGAWRLHRATLDRELDLFVLFSSAAGVLGNAGQANHAAANAFLDQLARHRRARGLPGQAIAWGAWSGVGEAEEARERIAGRLAALGEDWIAPERGLEALSRVVREDAAATLALAADWSRVPSRSAWLEELAAPEETPDEAASDDLPRRLRALPAPGREQELLRFLQGELVSVLRLRSTPEADAGFFELGMDSLMAVELRNRLNRAFGGALTVSNTAVFDHPDAGRLARYLAGEFGDAGPDVRASAAATVAAAAGPQAGERVAIVGMACRFPGGADVEAFWDLLRSGGDAVTPGRPDGLFVDAETEAARSFGGYLEGMDRFDAEFFRIAPVEAELLDPQQRLLLETSWAALEDAGMDPGGLRGSRTGVYGGLCGSDYQELVTALRDDPATNIYRATGIAASTAVGRVAFALGLTGPAITVDTACSSSLVAVHQAATALRQGEADLALAGGVNAVLVWAGTRLFSDAGMLAPDGRCKTFDASADGYVRGEGCGMLVLRRLSDAERDGDRILGVILGSAVNQDGASAGLTVPNGPAQEAVIEAALSRAEVAPDSVDYLEAHGTGTELGDPVEVAAAGSVYGRGRDPGRPLLLGSVKTNVGHLEGAAGVAGLMKALLAARHGVIPRHLHFETPNPRIEWDALPVRVTAEATAWPETSGRPRRAAVSSFGFSGTNAHLVLEGYDAPQPVAVGARDRLPSLGEMPLVERDRRVLPLSGRTGPALAALAGRYANWLEAEDRDGESLADAAWTAGVGRSHFGFRAGVSFGDGGELRDQLLALSAAGGERSAVPAEPPKVAFLFTGQGSQWAGMGRDLYEREPVFREVVDRCAGVFREERGAELLPVIFGEAAGLDRTEWTQPALFALSAGLTELWRSVGVRPEVVLGHSVGEVVAAWASGAVGLEEGFRFAARRGALMGSLPGGGGMAAVFAPVDVVEGSFGRRTRG